MNNRRESALVSRLSTYDSLCEVGVGRRPDVARALADAGCAVTATDVREFPVPDGVRFVRDDIVTASESTPGDHYRVDALYALNLPPELHRPFRAVARAVSADCLFTTLGFDEPTVPVRREQLDGETLYVADADVRSGPSSKPKRR
ncbi:hypothetical protein AUR64_06255 [Haloprofundus marisrubri]|uniref:UPF0146 protein AUR64_06255 n=1 Tax=Haloprofundus marisrubri TaxID=1514971 RepID=A0A0W1RBP1_9EURY|nr:UPF0146 family protein [Haloprofundus marisrubri]KTG10790.1 hypothetical protein AUR64_06255 [Haloprofundus marisrubri]